MLSLLAICGYVSLVLATAALMWAIREVEKSGGDPEWKPGRNPHDWRF
jgi:hypothetical protein